MRGLRRGKVLSPEQNPLAYTRLASQYRRASKNGQARRFVILGDPPRIEARRIRLASIGMVAHPTPDKY